MRRRPLTAPATEACERSERSRGSAGEAGLAFPRKKLRCVVREGGAAREAPSPARRSGTSSSRSPIWITTSLLSAGFDVIDRCDLTSKWISRSTYGGEWSLRMKHVAAGATLRRQSCLALGAPRSVAFSDGSAKRAMSHSSRGAEIIRAWLILNGFANTPKPSRMHVWEIELQHGLQGEAVPSHHKR